MYILRFNRNNFSQPHIRIWNSVSLATLCVIGNGEFDGSICCLSFSKADGGNYLCAIDETSDHNISIWDWQKGERGTKITETKVCFNSLIQLSQLISSRLNL